jgi:hypothetical protein
LPWKESSPVTERERFIDAYMGREETVAELSRRFGISRKTVRSSPGRRDGASERALQTHCLRPRRQQRGPGNLIDCSTSKAGCGHAGLWTADRPQPLDKRADAFAHMPTAPTATSLCSSEPGPERTENTNAVSPMSLDKSVTHVLDRAGGPHHPRPMKPTSADSPPVSCPLGGALPRPLCPDAPKARPSQEGLVRRSQRVRTPSPGARTASAR